MTINQNSAATIPLGQPLTVPTKTIPAPNCRIPDGSMAVS